MRTRAADPGADAVTGVRLDYSEFSGAGKSMLFLVAGGTFNRSVRQPRLNLGASIYWFIMAETIETAPIKPTITIDVLNKIDVRVGTIELVEGVKGSNKLVRLTVDFGDHKRTILAGMKQERQQPKEIEGKQALFVVNLERKQMMGEVSEAMLLDIGYADGITPALAMPERRVPNGARAG